jgi:hypothetical protein
MAKANRGRAAALCSQGTETAPYGQIYVGRARSAYGTVTKKKTRIQFGLKTLTEFLKDVIADGKIILNSPSGLA